jgi:serine/threonine protein kinase
LINKCHDTEVNMLERSEESIPHQNIIQTEEELKATVELAQGFYLYYDIYQVSLLSPGLRLLFERYVSDIQVALDIRYDPTRHHSKPPNYVEKSFAFFHNNLIKIIEQLTAINKKAREFCSLLSISSATYALYGQLSIALENIFEYIVTKYFFNYEVMEYYIPRWDCYGLWIKANEQDQAKEFTQGLVVAIQFNEAFLKVLHNPEYFTLDCNWVAHPRLQQFYNDSFFLALSEFILQVNILNGRKAKQRAKLPILDQKSTALAFPYQQPDTIAAGFKSLALMPKQIQALEENQRLLPDDKLRQINLQKKFFDEKKTINRYSKHLFNPPLKLSVLDMPNEFFIINGGEKQNKLLGSGSFGAVKLTQGARSGIFGALKVLKSDIQEEVEQEHAIAKQMGLAISPLFFRKKEHEVVYKPQFLMRYVPGVSFTQAISNPRIAKNRKIDIAIQALRRVKALHELGYVHNDLKSSNFKYYFGANLVELLDYGLALKMENGIARYPYAIGTFGYIAPELCITQKEYRYNEKTDVHELGVTLLHDLGVGKLNTEAREYGQRMCNLDPLQRPTLDEAILFFTELKQRNFSVLNIALLNLDACKNPVIMQRLIAKIKEQGQDIDEIYFTTHHADIPVRLENQLVNELEDFIPRGTFICPNAKMLRKYFSENEEAKSIATRCFGYRGNEAKALTIEFNNGVKKPTLAM